MSDAPLHYRTISEVSALLRDKEISSVELTQHMLSRIGDLDKRLKSYATVMSDSAVEQARIAEEEISSGRYRGPLHGVPIAVKDLCYTRGVRTMGGCKVLKDHIPAFDSTVVKRFKDAGAVLLGKLNLTEGAMGGYQPDFQIPVNPWASDRWAGNSSSGSGVATAAGLCYGSLGSDTGGSIRFPSAACSVTGIKPTWGRVSRYGVLDLAQSLDHVGPMARSASDAALLLQVISGLDSNDPTTLMDEVPDFMDGISGGVSGLRIGWDERYASEGIEEEVYASVESGLRQLEGMGAEIVKVVMPVDIDEYLSGWKIICISEALDAHREFYPDRREDYGPYFQGWLDGGAEITGPDYAQANNKRQELNGLIAVALQDVDVLVCPSTSEAPYPVTPEILYGPRDESRPALYQRFTVPFDFNGSPTISLPSGFTSEGLPLSLQVVGKNLSEQLLCRVGYAYQQETDWHNIHPKM